MRGQPGFFDVVERLKRLSGLGDHLEAFVAAVDFEMFRADLVAALAYSDGAQGGRPPFDPVAPALANASIVHCAPYLSPTILLHRYCRMSATISATTSLGLNGERRS